MSENLPGSDAEPLLEFDHNVIEHLGIRLYQNRPGNVLAEVVANCWDADATEVHITVSGADALAQDRFISIADNGFGMSFETIRTVYLRIGKPKRAGAKVKSPGGRGPMGRKGIGKLAPFGIARTVEVFTCAEGQMSWFALDLDGLIVAGKEGKPYAPTFTLKNVALDTTLPGTPPADVTAFVDHLRKSVTKTGTLVRMSRLTSNQTLSPADIEVALGRKFTVVLARPDFKVQINGTPLDAERALPEFELRIPSSGTTIETLSNGEVKFWVGFVGSAEWSSDQAGIGVFAHGKSAQDRPFFFGAKGKEVFQRYMYGVVEADWLDEFDEDLVSTDRSSLDWTSDKVAELQEWGRKKVGAWLSDYANFRSGKHLQETRKRAADRRSKKEVPVYSDTENEQIDQLVAEATRELGKNQSEVVDELIAAVSQAWINLPTRSLLRTLWSELANSGDSSEGFLKVASKLQEHSVPEAMGLAMTFAQRAYALSLLHKLVHEKSEENIQELIEDFPWILQPRGDLLTADQHMKTTIEHSALNDDTTDRAGRMIKGMSEKERADFVFLTDTSKKTIQIVELKAPGRELTAEHERQLRDYLDYVFTFHPKATLSGLLVGNPGSPPIETNDRRIQVRGWDEILLECRATYVQLLASMLERADPASGDTRVKLVLEFGGEPVWQLLSNMAKKDPVLAGVMKRFEHLLLPSPEVATAKAS